ncbi:hypothetical protein GGI23_000230 [Coemansia sp. RSA 2559]|nr:hypothetical protein GGI23_000230 [Coemansia sp. RSA 2559]KAJ2869595.1 hypothetical protein GGI22_000158 [Coemansia erecta]
MVGSRLLRYSALLVLFGAALLVQALDSQAMADFRMAVLYKNGEQTSCMVAVIDMKAGFVAANCIDLNNGKPDASTSYQVHFTPLHNAASFAVDLDPNDITIHPLYDPVNLANNIAVVQYNKDTTDAYHTFIETETIIGKSDVYTRWAFDQTTKNWTMPEISTQDSDDSDCAAGSALYSGNSFLTRCTSATLPSIENDACSMPYGIMFKVNRTDTIVVSHLYSHSVVYGDNMCDGKTKILSYYSSLWLYTSWMVKVLGRPLLIFTGTDETYFYNTNVGFVVDPNRLGNPSGTNIVTGDLYPVQRAMVAGTNSGSVSSSVTSKSGSSSSTPESGSSSDASGSDIEMSSSISDNPTEKDNSSGISSDFSNAQESRGLSKEAKITVGVAVPVVGIIIVVACAAIVIMKRKSKDKADDWDPQGEENQLRTAALELCLEYPQATPPPYSGEDIANARRYHQSERYEEIKKS